MPYRLVAVMLGLSACVAPESLEEKRSSIHDATTVVSLTFDDTFADNFQVGDIAAARGMSAVFFINSPRIGTSGYMTMSQLQTLEAQGHEIAGHTLTHARLTAITTAEARAQVCNDRVALLDAGFDVTTFAYPFAANNATVEQIVRDCGYNAARDVGGLVSPGACNGCPYANPIPPTTDLYKIRTSDSVDTGTTLAVLQQYVTQAEQRGGGFVPIVFHHVCNGCDDEAITPATLAAFLDWLEDRAPSTQVATVHEVIGGPVKPGVSEPPSPPPPPPPGSNLLQNPSLEVDENGNAVPDCWQRGSYGTNTASYALVNDAYDGNVAQRITISSFSSGGRRLTPSQDSGACAPSVTPGRSYTMTAYYKATTQPRFSVFYRNASGAWVWFAQSPLQPTSTTYRQATYTTPAMPAEATAISFGLTIFNVGTITIDAHTLVDASAPADTTAPVLSVACDGAACSTQSYASAVSVTLAASDAGSGVREIRYTTDGSDPVNGTVYTAAFTVSESTTVRATAVDNAGNRASQSTTITIEGSPADMTPPSLSIACDGAACSTQAYGSAVTVTLSASDAGSGLASVRYTTDGSDPATGTLYAAPFTVSVSSTVRATAVDNAGNAASQSVSIVIDDTAPPPPTNLLQNASLEIDADLNQIPDCWKRSGYGTNTASYTLVTDAFDGTVAQRLDITSWSSGGRRLASEQDAGTCAPSVTPGRTYTMTAYYKATVARQVAVYVRSTSGTWGWFATDVGHLPAGLVYDATDALGCDRDQRWHLDLRGRHDHDGRL